MKLRPLDKFLVLKKLEAEETTAAGIVLPNSAQEEDNKAEVVALGPKLDEKDGVSIGDKVVYKQFAGTDVEIEDTEYVVIDIEEILAVIEEE